MKNNVNRGKKIVLVAMAMATLSIWACWPLPARGAELTRVATAWEKNNPCDLDISVGYSRTQRLGTILRQRHQEGRIADVVVLRYSSIIEEMPLRLALGIFHDLELHLSTSVLFRQIQEWDYSARHTASVQDNISPVDAQGNSLENAEPFFSVPGKSYRQGWSNITLGLSWALFQAEKDDTKPQWLLSLDYTLPTASLNEPWLSTSKENPGAIGDKAHRLVLATAISKQMGKLDPYVKFSFSLPIAAKNSANLCTRPGAMCINSKDSTGEYDPPLVGGFLLGSEFHSSALNSEFLIDLQLGAFYVGEGRTYNEFSDVVGKLLQTDDYIHLGASGGIKINITGYFQFQVNASLYHDTEHFLTGEPLQTSDGKNNPSFDYRYDTPGRRFRISEASIFQVNAMGIARF